VHLGSICFFLPMRKKEGLWRREEEIRCFFLFFFLGGGGFLFFLGLGGGGGVFFLGGGCFFFFWGGWGLSVLFPPPPTRHENSLLLKKGSFQGLSPSSSRGSRLRSCDPVARSNERADCVFFFPFLEILEIRGVLLPPFWCASREMCSGLLLSFFPPRDLLATCIPEGFPSLPPFFCSFEREDDK